MLLDALQYGLSALNKPGRAVRGLLGGRPDEALAAIPFSDTLGLSDPGNEVTSDDLVRQLGGDPDELGGQAASLGLGIATDPLTYAGGAIARRLVGGYGGVARTGQAAADDAAGVYRLGDPMDHAVESLGGRVGRGGEEGAELAGKAEVPAEAVAEGERLIPGADAPMPGGELIDQLPSPAGYDPFIGRSAEHGYSPGEAGISGDIIQETGNRDDAFRQLLGGWDQTLNDLQRLRPEQRARLATPDGPRSVLVDEWQDLLHKRRGDINAAQMLGRRGALPGWGDLAGPLGAQEDQIVSLLPRYFGEQGGSQARFVVSDILDGLTRPGEATAAMTRYAPHLPFDEAALRRMAASGQEQLLQNSLHEGLEGVGRGVRLNELRGAVPDAQLIEELRGIFDPAGLAGTGIEPNIINSHLADPARQTPQIQQALALLEELRAAGM